MILDKTMILIQILYISIYDLNNKNHLDPYKSKVNIIRQLLITKICHYYYYLYYLNNPQLYKDKCKSIGKQWHYENPLT